MEHTADYNGWTNWETWNTALMMGNEEWSYNEARNIVSMSTNSMRLRDWAIENIIGPMNARAIKDAQEWNDIPEWDRLDPHYEDLKERNPDAADLVNNLGFGPDTSDYQPQLIDPELVNWDEIFESYEEDLREEQGDEVEYEDPDSPSATTFPSEWVSKLAANIQTEDESPMDKAMRQYNERQGAWNEIEPTQDEQDIQRLMSTNCGYCGDRGPLERVDNGPHQIGVFCRVCKNGTYWDPNPDMLPDRFLPKARMPTRRADADGWHEPAMTNLNQGVEIPGEAPGMPRNMETFQGDSNSEPCPHCGRPNVPIYVTVCPECGMRIRPGFEIAANFEGAPALYADPDPGNNWLYLNGKVATGDNFWSMAQKLAEEAGMSDEEIRFVTNQVARNHLPPDWDLAYGEVDEKGMPRIWASTVDRNHVWDVVKEAISEHTRV